jgi:pimeloyl-ACP methyl ester carboxylesterase
MAGPSGLHRVGAVELNYRLDGTGEVPLVCIHGVGSYLEAWDGVVQQLGDKFTVLTFDLRGHGQSSRIKGRYEIDDFVHETLTLADLVGFEGFNLAGFSLGGLIAQRMALTHADRLRRLILLSTVAGRTSDEQDRVRARAAALQSGERGEHYDNSLSRWLTEAFQAANPDLVNKLRARNASNDPECYAAAYRVLAETDFGGFLDQIGLPTLIATGENDIPTNPRIAQYMHDRIPGSELRILPGMRHSILTEAPNQVADLIREFVLKQDDEDGQSIA